MPEFFSEVGFENLDQQTIERNIDFLERALRNHDRWQDGPDAGVRVASMRFRVTDTGAICGKDDPLAVAEYRANYKLQGTRVTLESYKHDMVKSFEPLSQSASKIVDISLRETQEQFAEFPRLIPGTEINADTSKSVE